MFDQFSNHGPFSFGSTNVAIMYHSSEGGSRFDYVLAEVEGAEEKLRRKSRPKIQRSRFMASVQAREKRRRSWAGAWPAKRTSQAPWVVPRRPGVGMAATKEMRGSLRIRSASGRRRSSERSAAAAR